MYFVNCYQVRDIFKSYAVTNSNHPVNYMNNIPFLLVGQFDACMPDSEKHKVWTQIFIKFKILKVPNKFNRFVKP